MADETQTDEQAPSASEAKSPTEARAKTIYAPPPAQDHGPAIDRAIARWMAGHIRNSDVSRNTNAYNALVASLPALRAHLTEEL